jgi:ferredoxin
MSGWLVVADLDLCQGHQMCRLEAPEIFDRDPATDEVVIRQPQPPDRLRDDARRAVRECPALALSVIEPAEEDG